MNLHELTLSTEMVLSSDTIQFLLGIYLSKKHLLGFPRALHGIPFRLSCWPGLPSIKTSKVAVSGRRYCRMPSRESTKQRTLSELEQF